MVAQSHHGALGIQSVDHALIDCHHRAVKVGYIVRDHDIGHDLGGRSGIHLLIRALFIYNSAGIQILEIYRL